MNNNSKINVVEGMFLIMIAATADLAQILGTLAGTTGLGFFILILTWIYAMAIWAMILFWLKIKGVGFRWFLSGGVGEAIPILNSIPFFIAASLATIIQENSSLAKKALSATGMARKK